MVSLKSLTLLVATLGVTAVSAFNSSALRVTNVRPDQVGGNTGRTPTAQFPNRMWWTDYGINEGSPTMACGGQINRAQLESTRPYYASVGPRWFAGGAACGATVTINFQNGRTANAIIIDTCSGCEVMGTPALFRVGAPTDQGVQFVNFRVNS